MSAPRSRRVVYSDDTAGRRAGSFTKPATAPGRVRPMRTTLAPGGSYYRDLARAPRCEGRLCRQSAQAMRGKAFKKGPVLRFYGFGVWTANWRM
jgi:hypothetical protein